MRSNEVRTFSRLAERRGFRWAYRKARSYHAPILSALYRALRYELFNNTGWFHTHGGFKKTRIFFHSRRRD